MKQENHLSSQPNRPVSLLVYWFINEEIVSNNLDVQITIE
jgi:hypothetical protein